MTRIYAYGAICAALVALVLFYGQSRYKTGVRDTTAKFLKADLEGAEKVNETARKTINAIGDDFDVDGLLDSTNGFRDDDSNIQPTE